MTQELPSRVESRRANDLSEVMSGPLPVVVAVLGWSVFALRIPAVSDHAYQFHLARRVLDGAQLYVDVAASDMHPPLFTWLAMLLEFFARGVGSTGLACYPGFVVALAALVVTLVWRLSTRSALVLATVMLAALPLSGAYFGQGEHIAVLCALPYLCAAAREPHEVGRGMRAAIAALAAFGLAMKPHFALVWVLVECYRALRFGRASLWRLENLIIGSVFVLYVLATVLFHPQFFALLPWVAQLYPQFFPKPWSALLFDARGLLVLTAVAAALTVRDSQYWTRAAHMVALAALATYLAMLLQHKGWGYHWYPVVAFSLIAIGIRLRVVLAPVARLLVPASALAAIVLASVQPLRIAQLLNVWPTDLNQTIALTQRHAAGRPVVVLSEYIQAGFPLVGDTDIEWPLPYAHLWMVRVIHDLPPAQAAHWRPLEMQIVDRIWEAVQRSRPGLLMVERAVTPGMDMRAYFEADPRFQTLFQRATLVASTPSHDFYTLAPEAPRE